MPRQAYRPVAVPIDQLPPIVRGPAFSRPEPLTGQTRVYLSNAERAEIVAVAESNAAENDAAVKAGTVPDHVASIGKAGRTGPKFVDSIGGVVVNAAVSFVARKACLSRIYLAPIGSPMVFTARITSSPNADRNTVLNTAAGWAYFYADRSAVRRSSANAA